MQIEGVEVRFGGNVPCFRWRPDPENPRAANADTVIDRAGRVAALVQSAPPDDTVLVLGGDCTVGVGSVAGLHDRVDRLGVVYVDRDADLNVPQSTRDGALDWMGVAHMLDINGALRGLASLTGDRPMLSSNQISFLGLGRFTDFEARVIADRELPVVDMRQLAADPRGSAQLSLSPLAECDGLAIHFDVDLVDFLDAPLAENTDRGQAPSLTACGDALGELLSDARVRALTVTEFNPHHGSPNGSTTKRLIDVIATAIGRGD